MDAFTTFAIITGSMAFGLGLLGLAAIRFGVDSRPGIGDDHAR